MPRKNNDALTAARLIDGAFAELDDVLERCERCGDRLLDWDGEGVCPTCTVIIPVGHRRPTTPAPALRRAA